jgi:hypothetical protein
MAAGGRKATAMAEAPLMCYLYNGSAASVLGIINRRRAATAGKVMAAKSDENAEEYVFSISMSIMKKRN